MPHSGAIRFARLVTALAAAPSEPSVFSDRALTKERAAETRILRVGRSILRDASSMSDRPLGPPLRMSMGFLRVRDLDGLEERVDDFLALGVIVSRETMRAMSWRLPSSPRGIGQIDEIRKLVNLPGERAVLVKTACAAHRDVDGRLRFEHDADKRLLGHDLDELAFQRSVIVGREGAGLESGAVEVVDALDTLLDGGRAAKRRVFGEVTALGVTDDVENLSGRYVWLATVSRYSTARSCAGTGIVKAMLKSSRQPMVEVSVPRNDTQVNMSL